MIKVFTDPRCLEHVAPRGYPERPERLQGVLAHLAASGRTLVERGVAHGVARAAVHAVHDPAYVARFERAVECGDSLFDSADNPICPASSDAAWAAVEATLAAADHVASSESGSAGTMAFAAVRPPGHHAEHALAMGFCFFNNAAVAAEYLRRERGFSRIAIFDPDVHHGNGTQHLFEDRADVLYLSTHQFPFYPGTGAETEVGLGVGKGATVNVPLPLGTDDAGYRRAFEERIYPAIRAFAPEVLVISAGFDAWAGDPLGGMKVSEEGFEQWGRGLGALAHELSGGRLLAVLEGGYDLANLPRLVEAFLRGLESAGREID
jgi:acetoin utilization deacetylase AcuC-like enzyme